MVQVSSISEELRKTEIPGAVVREQNGTWVTLL
jgi:hypothetical protein